MSRCVCVCMCADALPRLAASRRAGVDVRHPRLSPPCCDARLAATCSVGPAPGLLRHGLSRHGLVALGRAPGRPRHPGRGSSAPRGAAPAGGAACLRATNEESARKRTRMSRSWTRRPGGITGKGPDTLGGCGFGNANAALEVTIEVKSQHWK